MELKSGQEKGSPDKLRHCHFSKKVRWAGYQECKREQCGFMRQVELGFNSSKSEALGPSPKQKIPWLELSVSL